MRFSTFRARLKPWILPLAMVCGMLFHTAIESVQFLAPYLIFTMLFITFCRLRPGEFRIGRLTAAVVGVQLAGAVAVYLACLPLGDDAAQGAMICILCPTATAAPVITALLGGSISTLIAISLLSNLATAIAAPAFFALINPEASISFTALFLSILAKVGPMILAPLLLTLLLNYAAPRLHDRIASFQPLSFYLWAISLIIVVGRAVSFAMHEPPNRIPEMIVLALLAGTVCIAQFYIGRRLGARMGDKIAGAQGLGQKNTVLAVWMAISFLNPVSSIAPAAYIAWQNSINSLQLYLKTRREAEPNRL